LKLAKLWSYKKKEMENKLDNIRKNRDRGKLSDFIKGNNKSSSTVYHSPLLDIGLSNISPSRWIFGYSHPSPAVLRKSSLHLA
jgi:hypothetical protein